MKLLVHGQEALLHNVELYLDLCQFLLQVVSVSFLLSHLFTTGPEVF